MPQAGAVLDQAELIALPVSWQTVIVRTKSTGFTPKTSELRKMADRTSSAAITDCSTGFELETRNSATDHDDSGGGWSLSVGALRHVVRDCRRSRASPVRQISPASRRMASHALMIPPRRQERSFAEVDIWTRQSLGEDLLKIALRVWAVNLEHAGRPTLSQRTGA